jgi:hypothetical protein
LPQVVAFAFLVSVCPAQAAYSADATSVTGVPSTLVCSSCLFASFKRRSMTPARCTQFADGAVMKEKVIPAVKDGGAFTSVRGFEGAPTRGIRFTSTYVRDYTFEHDKPDRLRQLVDEGKITLRVAATNKPEEASEAHRHLEARGTRGRIVITF